MKHAKTWKRVLAGLLAAAVVLPAALWAVQRFWAHRNGYFLPDYPRVALTPDSPADTVFLQTGLGPPAVRRLREEGNFQAILDAQELFFHPPEASCTPMLGWFTREDRLASPGPALADLQPGDVLVALSTHSVGWRHGHAGLVISPDTVLECMVVGTDSACFTPDHWRDYTNYALLRPKDVEPGLGQEVADYGMAELLGVPYHLSAGFLGPKAPDPDDVQFGLQCSYLVWYAYQHFGIDLDSDGGRLVSPYDLLHSGELEVVQLYGMDPRPFLEAAD